MDYPAIYAIVGSGEPLKVEPRGPDAFKDDRYFLGSALKRKLEKSLEHVPRSFDVILKHDEDYINNKFLCSIYVLDFSNVTKYLSEVSIETLTFGLNMIVGVAQMHLYPYSINTDGHHLIVKLILDRLKVILKSDDFYSLIKDLSKLASEGNIYLGTFRYSFVQDKFREVPHFSPDIYPLMPILQDYEDLKDEIICKYCLCSLPVSQLVRPCQCKNPVHTFCFLAWYNKDKHVCEICHDSFSRLNEPRIGGREEIFFPFDDIYPTPIMTTSGPRKVSGKERYAAAICYRQNKRLVELLEESIEPLVECPPTRMEITNPMSNYHYMKNLVACLELLEILDGYGIKVVDK